METVTAKTKQRTTARGRLEVERRWVIRDIGWDDYEELGELLPSTFRLAFDGSSLEIMVTGQLHDDYADALDTFFKAVAGALGVQFTPYRTASWTRPELCAGNPGRQLLLFDRGQDQGGTYRPCKEIQRREGLSEPGPGHRGGSFTPED